MYQTEKSDDSIKYMDLFENVELELPSCEFAGLVLAPVLPSIQSQEEIKQLACQPIDGPSLTELVESRLAKSACILISDATRQVPTRDIARYLVEELVQGGVPAASICFIVAIGVHRDATPDEITAFLGPDLAGQVRALNHTPDAPDNLISLGQTTFGTPVEINRIAYACALHLSIGKVEPHEFAGFSGGRKSVLPGIASRETISRNHAPEMIGSERSCPGSLAGNPIHEDMVQAADLFRIDYTVQVVVDANNNILAGFAGPLQMAHQAAIDFYLQNCRICVPKPDIIVTTPGYPLNIDFYQSLKPLIALSDLVDERITLVLYSNCPEGVNSDDMLLPFKSCPDLADAIEYANAHYTIQMDHSLLISKLLRKNVSIIVWSPHVDASDLTAMHMIPCEGPHKLLELARQTCGKQSPQILFVPQAQRFLLEFA